MSVHREHSTTIWIGLGLFLFLSAVYLLTFTGSYYSIDEMAMFNMAETLLKEGRFSVDQLNWIEWSGMPIGAYGPDGRLYCKLAQTLSLVVLPLVWLARQVASVGTIQTAFLVNVFLTALNGLLILWLGVRLGYKHQSSLVAALMFGLTTIALPYARTFFSETLAGFCLLGALVLLVEPDPRNALWRPMLAGSLLGLAAASRLMNLALIPFYILYLILKTSDTIAPCGGARLWLKPLWRQMLACWRSLAALLLPLTLTGILIGWYNLGRFGNVLEAGYAPWERFDGNVLTGLYTLLLSPGKSLFLYTPVYLLSLFLLPRFLRQNRAEGTLILAVTVAYLIVLARWWAPYAGWCWGPRYLVPLAPLLALPLLALADAAAGSIRWRAAALLLAPISLGVQLLGATVDFAEWLRRLPSHQAPPESLITVFDPRFAAHLGHTQMLLQGRLDLAWLQRQGLDPVNGVDWRALLPLLGLLALATLGLLAVIRLGSRPVAVSLLLAGLFALPVVTWATLRHYAQNRLTSRETALAVVEVLESHNQTGDAILSAAVTHSQTFQNLYKGHLPIYGVRNDPLPYPAQAAERLARFTDRHQRLWLLLEWAPPRDPNSGLEMWLAQRAFHAGEWDMGALRLSLYDLGPAPPIVEQEWRLGNSIALQGYGLSPLAVSAGEIVRLSLIWSARQPMEQDYTVFVHLLDETGRLVAQVDRQPWGGLRPTSTWQPGQTLTDRHGLLIDEGLPAGHYRLAVGLYAWPSLERLPVVDASGNVVGDHLLLPAIQVLSETAETP